MALRLLIVALLANAAVAAKVTPIEKVTQLLKGLQAKVEAGGKKEAAAYDKYACFCKEQADEKLYAMEKSDETIEKLSAKIESLDADITGLNADISKLNRKISGLDSKIDDNAKARAKDHAKYQDKATDLSEAIESCAAAIEALKESKGGLTDAKLNLIQVLHSRFLATATRQAVSADAMALIEKLGLSKQAPAKFTFQSNDIIAVLEDLLSTFKQNKVDMDTEEFDINSLFEKEALGDANQRKFAAQEKDERAALAEEKTEDVFNARESNDEEKTDRAADKSFLDNLTNECEEKAKLFDQRSSTRTDELAAMTAAIAKLEEGVKPNEGANKKLVGLLQSRLAPSFIQVHTLQENSNRAVRRVQELLQEAGSSLDSSVLKSLAVRVQLSADHFVKVRGLIKDLIDKLKADAKSEAEQKSFCDKAMKKALTDRDTGKSRQEAAGAKISTLTSRKEDLTEDIADLTAKIAENKKALNEAMELRSQESAENTATVASAEQGHEAVNMALTLLSDFYGANAFLQTKKYTPPKSDRDGKTVGDLAPKVFDEEYNGAQAESKGIIGILEVIASDFERTIKTVTNEEKTAQDAFNKFEKEANDDTNAKSETQSKKEAEVKKTEGEILEQEQNLKDSTDLFQSGEDKLDDLKAACVEGEETWEERAAARKKEVEALKEAMTVLDEWQA